MTIVFIPGIKGSRLVNSEGKLCWVGLKQILGLDQHSLKLTLANETKNTVFSLHPDGILSNVLWQPIYSPFLTWIKENNKQDIHIFSYDWRIDCQEIANQFQIYLENLVAQKGPLMVMAHSLGGLITFSVLLNAPTLFQRILFAGVPFGTGIAFAHDMHVGERIGLNNYIMNYETHFSWRTPYIFFPLPDENNRLVDPKGNAIPFNWYSALDWERYKLSVFKQAADPNKILSYQQHLKIVLEQAFHFRKKLTLTNKENLKTIPIAVLASQAHKTRSELVFDQSNLNNPWQFDQGRTTMGDGRVTFKAAMVPKPLSYKLFTTSNHHSSLFNDSQILNEIMIWLTQSTF